VRKGFIGQTPRFALNYYFFNKIILPAQNDFQSEGVQLQNLIEILSFE